MLNDGRKRQVLFKEGYMCIGLDQLKTQSQTLPNNTKGLLYIETFVHVSSERMISRN